MSGTERTFTVAVERHELRSERSFDNVLAGVHAGLGHPDFPALLRTLAAVTDWDAYRRLVAEQAGPSGLMVFLELDHGGVVTRDPDASPARVVRIIAGNAVTAESMVRTTPQAGAFAPVTILVFERDNEVLVRYDTVTSAVGSDLTTEAREHAQTLDAHVLALLRAATRAEGRPA